jgi:uncharacterized protein (TIGR02300 family)
MGDRNDTKQKPLTKTTPHGTRRGNSRKPRQEIPMPKEEWGVKRICPKCSVRFYDLQNDPMTCPSCGAVFDIESLTAPKGRASAGQRSKEEDTSKVASDDLVDEDVVLDDDDESDGDLDDELLEDDDDDSVDLDDIADVASDDDEN